MGRAFVVASVLAGGGYGLVDAQTLGAPSDTSGRVVEGDVVEGRISRVDERARTITLDNGQEYLLLPPLALDWQLLRAGAAVKMRYSVDAGRNLATYVEVRP